MPFDSNGVFSLTPGYLAVTGQTILPTNHNPPLEDIAAQGLSSVLVRDGRAPMIGNLNMGGFKLTNVLAGTATTDGVNKGQLDAASSKYLLKNAGYTAVVADNTASIRFTVAATLALATAASLGSGWKINVIADGGAVTIDPNGSETINGLTTVIVPNGSSAEIICDGSNFFMVFRPSGWQTIELRSFSAVSAVDFTNLGAFARLRLTGFISLSSSGILGWRSSTNNGSSYDAGASDYSFQGQTAIDTTLAGSRTTAASFGLLGGGGTAEVPESLFVNFNVSGQACVSVARGTAFNGGGTTIFNRQDGAIRNDTTARNALRVFPTTAITLTGTLLLEGSVS